MFCSKQVMIGTSKSVWGFDPRSVPGCQLWLDGADTSSMTLSGSTITQWNDKSGNGKNAVSTGTPTYLTGGGVNFNGSSYFLNQTFTMNLSQRSIFIVMQETSRSIYSGILTFIPTPNSGSDQSLLTVETTNGVEFLAGDSGYSSVLGNSSLIAKGIYNDNMSVTTGSGYFNGTNATNRNASSAAGTSSGYTVGGRWQAGSMSASYRLNGVIYEIIIFNIAVTTSERQQVEGYLAHKWGIQTSLPITQSFYSLRPHLRTFQLINVPGCQLWLDAADSLSLVLSGSSVTTWNDKSGNGYHMNTLTAKAAWSGTAEYPTIGTSINGLQTINFTPQAGLRQSITLDGVKNLFWVGRIAAPTGTGDVHNSYFFLGHETHIDWHGLPYGGKFLDPAFATAGILNASPTSLFTSDSNAITNTAFSNVFKPSAPNVSLLSVSGITGSTRYQGLCFDRIYHFGWCGDLAEVLIYSTALTTAQRQQVEGYLAHKWGLASTIPSTHSFSKFPPSSVTPNKPLAIETVTLISLTTSGTINWTSSTNATGYTWYVGTGSGSGQVASGTITNGSTLTATVTYAFVIGTTYYAWVIPYNVDGLGPTTISAPVIFSGAFSPTSIPGCQLWLDGNDPAGTGIQPANGATVSTWVDKSGNGRNATVAPSRVVGTYSTSFKAVNFATSSTGYITTYSAAPTNETMFVVFNNPSPSAFNNILIGGVQGARSLGAGYTANGTGTVGNLNTQVAWLARTGSYTAGTTMIVTSKFTTSTNTVSLNGGVNTASGGAPGFTAGRVTYLGVDASQAVYYYVGYGMEIVFYNSVLTTLQTQQVEGYLAHKWGLTGSLPAGHPYKTVQP
jgi:hypothetical protein